MIESKDRAIKTRGGRGQGYEVRMKSKKGRRKGKCLMY
jgi:hypothetical protein